MPLLVLWLATSHAAARTPSEAAWYLSRAAIARAEYDRADRIALDSLARYPDVSDEWFWELRVLRGQTLCWTYRPKEALDWLSTELPASLRDSMAGVRRAVNLAIAHHMTGDPQRRAALLEEARRLAERHPAVHTEVLAWSSILESNPAKGEEYARAALKLAQAQRQEFFEISAMNEIAFRCNQQARYGEAMHWWEKLLLLCEERGLDAWVQKIEGNLGWAYMELGDFDTAAELFENALRTASRLETPGDRTKWTNQRGNVALQMRDYATAEKFCSEAVRLSGWKLSKELGHTLANLARLAVETGRAHLAQCRNDAAFAVKMLVGDAEGAQRSQILNAQIASLRGDASTAVRILGDIASVARQPSIRWEAQGRMAQVLAGSRRDGEAEAQFRNAIETVRAARASIDNRDLRFAFFRVAEDVFDAYVDFLVDRGRAGEALEVTERIRAQSLEEGLGIAASKSRIDPRMLAQERGATILCYWLGRAKSYVWVITPQTVVLKTLSGEREIETLIDAYHRATLNPHVRLLQTRNMGEQLFAMLVAPASGATGRGARVIVVPDGRMHVLNMESLVVPGPAMRFWIEDVTLVNASSLQLLARKDEQRPRNGALLLVGNPPPADAAYPPLTKAKLEIEKVQRHFPRRLVLDGPRATPGEFRSASPGEFEFLHFVAHGEATRRRPLDAAVILGRDSTGAYKLLARDIVGRRLAARLVTVSSCHGAGTRAFVGEGLVGLAWAFQQAGARQVVAALWEVDDVATPDLMDAMYARISAGDDPASALRKAKLRLVASNGIYRKPFYWAPFVLYGG